MAADERRVVAFLGPAGSYTHQAALDAFTKDQVTLSPQVSIADVFTAVQNGAAYRGVVPFENSSNGSVVSTLDLIGDVHNQHPDILVCGEAYVAVQHCLVGHAWPTATGGGGGGGGGETTHPLSHIQRLYSHPQAWGQCTAFLAARLPGIERLDVSSTSRAAHLVACDETRRSAALSSRVAAQLVGLDVLAHNVNDRPGNTTRFLVIGRRADVHNTVFLLSSPSPSSPAPKHDDDDDQQEEEEEEEEKEEEKEASYKTLVTFTVDHAHPGALALCLAVFAKYGLNLTSINTRPSGVQNWHYLFFVELQGRRRRQQNGEGPVDCALRELHGVARGSRWLGSWESRLIE
ncbi:prephenate dehydratase [Pleosporales sp. CAS-2024a]